MFDGLYQLIKFQVSITAINNGFLVSINKPIDQSEIMMPMVDAFKNLANKGEEWKEREKVVDEKIKEGIHFFKKEEPEKLMAFLSELFL